MTPDSWTGSRTYPKVNRNSWDNLRRVWLDSDVSTSVVATNKESVARNTVAADETGEQISDVFLDQKLKPKWKETRNGVEEGNEGTHFELAMSHTWDKEAHPLYQHMRSNIDGDFLRMKYTDTQVNEGTLEHSKGHHSTSLRRNDFLWGTDLGSTDTIIGDKEAIHEDLSFGEFVHDSNNGPKDKNLELPDSFVAGQIEKKMTNR